MGDVRHWVTRFEPAKLAAAGIYAFALVTCSSIIADAIRSSTPMSLSIEVKNEGNKPVMRAFNVGRDGKLVPIQ